MEMAANRITEKQPKVFSPFAISDEKQCAWSSLTVIEEDGDSESYAKSKFAFAKSAIFTHASVLYFPKLGQIQHGIIKYGNKSTL